MALLPGWSRSKFHYYDWNHSGAISSLSLELNYYHETNILQFRFPFSLSIDVSTFCVSSIVSTTCKLQRDLYMFNTTVIDLSILQLQLLIIRIVGIVISITTQWSKQKEIYRYIFDEYWTLNINIALKLGYLHGLSTLGMLRIVELFSDHQWQLTWMSGGGSDKPKKTKRELRTCFFA